jgi:hypothetical protein
LKRRNYREETVSGVDFGPGKKNLTGGSQSSEGTREERDTHLGKIRWAAGWISRLGRKASPRPFLIFSFSFSFLFLVCHISFISFAY